MSYPFHAPFHIPFHFLTTSGPVYHGQKSGVLAGTTQRIHFRTVMELGLQQLSSGGGSHFVWEKNGEGKSQESDPWLPGSEFGIFWCRSIHGILVDFMGFFHGIGKNIQINRPTSIPWILWDWIEPCLNKKPSPLFFKALLAPSHKTKTKKRYQKMIPGAKSSHLEKKQLSA